MDWGTVLSWLFGIISTLLGGLNIFQWITLKSYKRVKQAEAASAEIDSLSKIIERNQAEIARLSQRLNDADQRALAQDRRYEELSNKYDALREEFFNYKQTHK